MKVFDGKGDAVNRENLVIVQECEVNFRCGRIVSTFYGQGDGEEEWNRVRGHLLVVARTVRQWWKSGLMIGDC